MAVLAETSAPSAVIARRATARARRHRRGGPIWRSALALTLNRLAVLSVLAAMAGPGARALLAAVPSGEPARVRVAASLVDEVVRALLPVDVLLLVQAGGAADGGAPPGPLALVLTELRYCGATDKGNGRFRAVLRSASAAGAGTAVLGADDACRQNLADLIRQPAGKVGRDELGLAEVEAIWHPWELRLALTRMAGLGSARPGDPHPVAVALENRRDLLALTTAGIRVPTDTGEAITLHVAPAFGPEAIDLVTVVGEGGGVPPPPRGAGGQPPPLAGGANVAAELPHGFINQVLRQLTTSRPYSIALGRDIIDVQNVSVTGASAASAGAAPAASLAVVGLATPRSVRETARLTIQVGGDEARVLAVGAEPQLESCAGMGTLANIGCNTRNAGRSAAAAALGAALSQRYAGQVVRDLAGPQTLRLEPGRRRLEARGELLHLSGGPRGLSLTGRFALGGFAH